MQPITITLPDGVVLGVVVPDEHTYRLIRGALIHRDEINGHMLGEVRIVYGAGDDVTYNYRVVTHLQG